MRICADYSVRHTLGLMSEAFKEAGIQSAAADARFLVQGIMQIDAAELLRDHEHQIGSKSQALTDALQRRLKLEPVSRILGTRKFYGRPFAVTPDVLDPRPDTECLIDLALDIIRSDVELQYRLKIADIGTGSGAIIVTLLAELPYARGIATDISPPAIEVARHNAARLGVNDRLTLISTRGLSGVNVAANVIVSNPPYVRSGDIPILDVDVRDYDPHLALDGGTDGLAVYREIARDVSKIDSVSWVILEIGAGQLADVEEIFVSIGGAAQHRRVDLGGHIRCVAFRIHR